MDLTKKCSKCRKSLPVTSFEEKNDGNLYATCKTCRPKSNRQSSESYQRTKGVTCEECGKQYSGKQNLKKHLWLKHNIGNGKWFICPECEYKSKIKGNLVQHLRQKHSFGKETWFECPECEYKSKTKGSLKTHLWRKHDIGDGEIFRCEECDYTCKDRGNFTRHLWMRHDIGDRTVFECLECAYTSKDRGNLKRHLWMKHGIGEKDLLCCSNCPYETKDSSALKKHLTSVHDIGDKTCEYCLKNVSFLSSYLEPKTLDKAEICRTCYSRVTGYSTRKEKQMVEYLRKLFDPFIILQDSTLKGDICKTRRRPDLLLSSTKDLAILVECDENQHSGYDQSCETGRLNEILDELIETRVSIIRWNPDYYKKEGKRGMKTRLERLKMLASLLNVLVNKDWNEDDQMTVYYMFYTEENPAITTQFKTCMIYEDEDIEKI